MVDTTETLERMRRRLVEGRGSVEGVLAVEEAVWHGMLGLGVTTEMRLRGGDLGMVYVA